MPSAKCLTTINDDMLQPLVRQESCQGLYRLCIGRTLEGQTGYSYLLPVLSSLLTHLDHAQQMRTPRKRVSATSTSQV